METNNYPSAQPQSITTLFQSTFQVQPENRIPLSIYIPDRDRNNRPIDIFFWKELITTQMSLLYGGCSLSSVQGFWLQGEVLISENTSIITTYITPHEFAASVHSFKSMLYRLYYQTNQDTLLITLGDQIYYFRPEQNNAN